MHKQYKTVIFVETLGDTGWNDFIQSYNDDGWELISHTYQGDKKTIGIGWYPKFHCLFAKPRMSQVSK